MKYPCPLNIGETATGNKVWCSAIGKKSVTAQLVHEEVCKNCEIRRTVNEPASEFARRIRFESIFKRYAQPTCSYLSQVKTTTGCCTSTTKSHCSALQENVNKRICETCRIRPIKTEDFAVIIPVFNLTEHRLSSLKATLQSFQRVAKATSVIFAYRPSEKAVLDQFLRETKCNPILIERTERQEYFLKEELFNWVLRNKKLPDYTFFMDADSALIETDWPEKAIHLLQNGYDFVQCYDTCTYYGVDGKVEYITKSSARQWVQLGNSGASGCPGLGWAAKTKTWKEINGFPSIMALGNGDAVFFCALSGKHSSEWFPKEVMDKVSWSGNNYSIGYTKNISAVHYFDGVPHGQKRYGEKRALFFSTDNSLFSIAENGLPEFCVPESYEIRKSIECLTK